MVLRRSKTPENACRTSCASAELDAGLRELERLRRRVDAASVRVVARMGVSGRDVAAAVTRATGRSSRSARELVAAMVVAEKVEGAGDPLAGGNVSIEHLRALTPVADLVDAAGLVSFAVAQSPEEFASTVARIQLDRDAEGVRERQRATRSVRFFGADHGNVGMRAVLTPLEGAELRSLLMHRTDDAWRVAHPDRAETLGKHHGAV